jgi:hypothetical protein
MQSRSWRRAFSISRRRNSGAGALDAVAVDVKMPPVAVTPPLQREDVFYFVREIFVVNSTHSDCPVRRFLNLAPYETPEYTVCINEIFS